MATSLSLSPNFECQLDLLLPHLNTGNLMAEEYGLYVYSCSMNSRCVYKRWEGWYLKDEKDPTEKYLVPSLVNVTQAGRFPQEKGYFISTPGVIYSSRLHNDQVVPCIIPELKSPKTHGGEVPGQCVVNVACQQGIWKMSGWE